MEVARRRKESALGGGWSGEEEVSLSVGTGQRSLGPWERMNLKGPGAHQQHREAETPEGQQQP